MHFQNNKPHRRVDLVTISPTQERKLLLSLGFGVGFASQGSYVQGVNFDDHVA